MSSSVHVDNNKKYILTLGEFPPQGLDDTTLTAEKRYSINFTASRKQFCSSLHYNRENNYLFVNDVGIHEFKANSSEIKSVPLCLGNVSEDVSVDNIKATGLYRYVFDFSVDQSAIAADDI